MAFTPVSYFRRKETQERICSGLWKHGQRTDLRRRETNAVGHFRIDQTRDLWLGTGYSGLPYPPPQRGLRPHRVTIACLKPGLSVAAAQQRLEMLQANPAGRG